MILRIFDTEIKIEYPFFIVLSLAFFVEEKRILMVLLFSAMHETGHLITLYLLGGKVDRLTFSYYGIGLRHSTDFSVFREVIFLMSGISVNALFYLLGVQQDVNAALLIINALPIYPLDMGRCLCLLMEYTLPYSFSQKVTGVISVIFIVGILGYSVYSANFNLFIISVYLVLFSLAK